jgi:exodeoxyribonuclease V alpha subunit
VIGASPVTGAVGSAGRPAAGDTGDPFRAELVLGAHVPELLRVFNQAGVLMPADVHAALRLARLAGEVDEQVMLAVGLAVRGPRVGHVSVDLADVRASVVVSEDDLGLDGLPWPDLGAWVERVAASPLVGPLSGPESDPAAVRPLRLVGTSLYLDRYWRDEVTLAADLLARAASSGAGGHDPFGDQAGPDDGFPSADDLERLFPGAASADQRAASEAAARRRLTVLAGGPGTGKTTTVARLLALLYEAALRTGRRPPLVALAAPTGKAAARMEEAVRAEAGRLDTTEQVRALLRDLAGTTLHRLLGTRPDRPGRFRHHQGHRLPHEVVVVDEVSMVSLSLMARLAESVRGDARLILVGDPEQLVSVEAGAVLADIVTPPAGWGAGPLGPTGPTPHPSSPMAGCISILRTNHRFAGALAELSEAVRAGDADLVLGILSSGGASTAWEDADPGELLANARSPGPLDRLAQATTEWAARVQDEARAGRADAALSALSSHRVLCAHRQGPAGVAVWNRTIEGWLIGAGAGEGSWYPGRPVLVTANDYSLRLFNGDTGVTLAVPEGTDPGGATAMRVVFDSGAGGGSRAFSPSRLDTVETVFAMTVHKSQGSEFDHVTLLLPPATSRLLSRQLLYTALTRARRSILVVGTEAAVRAAIERPIARASGLGSRLWGASAGD